MISVSLRETPSFDLILSPDSDADEMVRKIAHANERLKELSATYSENHRGDVAATRLELTRIARKAKGKSAERAAAAAEPFQGFGNISKCVGFGVKDKFTGSEELVGYATNALLPATGLLMETHRNLVATLEALRQRSLARANDYRRESLELAKSAGIDPVTLGLNPRAGSSIAAGPNSAISSARSAAISIGLEAVMIKLTWDSIKKVLQPLIVKAAKTAGAAGTAAVVDGPVPVGDVIAAVIAVGGGLWTAWEIREAVEANSTLPATIEHALNEQLNELGATASGNLDSLVQSLASLYQIDT